MKFASAPLLLLHLSPNARRNPFFLPPSAGGRRRKNASAATARSARLASSSEQGSVKEGSQGGVCGGL
jgi:hypothetical protein